MKVKSIAAAALLVASTAWTPAYSADLGGDCCADLEERVAELEATTARKGNRKVSLTVSGQVNELVYWWDNGQESNAYVGTSGFSSSRFRFLGSAQINADWSAGYLIEVEVVSAQVNRTDQHDDDGSIGTNLRHSMWYLQSKTLGKISVGHTSHAADDITSSVCLGGVCGTAAQGNIDAAPGAALRFTGAGGSYFRASQLFAVGDVDRANIIRYDTPSIAGFVLSADWGEDDMWSVALRYAGEFNGIKIAAAVGYFEDHDCNGAGGGKCALYNDDLSPGDSGDRIYGDYNEIRASGAILHTPTGLFAEGGYVHREFDDTNGHDFNYWFVRAGIYQKFFALGKTSISGEYGSVSNDTYKSYEVDDDVFKDLSDGRHFGINLVQDIDSAAMNIFLGWRRFEADGPTDSIDTIYSGARIQF